jgi:hypothetical protein
LKAQKEIVEFMRKTAGVNDVKKKFAKTHKQLMLVRHLFEQSMIKNKAKVYYLRLLFGEEVKRYINECAKSKDAKLRGQIKAL